MLIGFRCCSMWNSPIDLIGPAERGSARQAPGNGALLWHDTFNVSRLGQGNNPFPVGTGIPAGRGADDETSRQVSGTRQTTQRASHQQQQQPSTMQIFVKTLTGEWLISVGLFPSRALAGLTVYSAFLNPLDKLFLFPPCLRCCCATLSLWSCRNALSLARFSWLIRIVAWYVRLL